MQARLGTIVCKFGGDPPIRLREAIFVKSQKCPYRVTFDLDLVLEHTLDAGRAGTIVCKFGRDPAIFSGRRFAENVYRGTDRQTDDGRRTIALAHGMS